MILTSLATYCLLLKLHFFSLFKAEFISREFSNLASAAVFKVAMFFFSKGLVLATAMCRLENL